MPLSAKEDFNKDGMEISFPITTMIKSD